MLTFRGKGGVDMSQLVKSESEAQAGQDNHRGSQRKGGDGHDTGDEHGS